MLDQTRLQRNPLLVASGWDPARHGRLKARLARIDPRFPPQVPPETLRSCRNYRPLGMILGGQFSFLGSGTILPAIGWWMRPGSSTFATS